MDVSTAGSPGDPECTEQRVERATRAAGLAPAGGIGGRKGRKRILILAVTVAAAVVVVRTTPLQEWFGNIQKWKDWIDSYGIAALAVFFVASVSVVAMGLPRYFICAVAGMLFGFLQGVSMALASTVLGAYCTYAFAHWGGRHWAERQIARYKMLQSLSRRPGIGGVFLIRQLPVPGLVPNLFMGVIAVPQKTFLIGTLLGYIPSTIIVTLIGSGIGKESLMHSLGQITASILLLAVASWGIMLLRKRFVGGNRNV